MRLHWYVLLLSLLLYGCVMPGVRDQRDDNPHQPPQFQVLREDQLPFEIQAVVALLTNKLRGDTTKPPAGLEFAPQGKHTVQGTGFQYKNFAFQGMAIIAYDTKKQEGDKVLGGLAAVLRFGDKLGRLANVSVVTRFEFTPTSLSILDSNIKPLSAPVPPVVCFFVPLEAYTKASHGLNSFEALLRFVAQNHVRLQPTAEETARFKSWGRLPDAEKKVLADKHYPLRRYAVLAFSMESVFSPSALSMGYATHPGGPLIHPERARFQDYNGWQVGIFEGEFALDHPENKGYIRVDYTPEASVRLPGAPNTYPVGLFAMQKNHPQ